MKNEFKVCGEITFIRLNRRGKEPLFAIIDTEDLEKVSSIPGSWRAHWDKYINGYYVRTVVHKKTIYMHRLLMDVSDSKLYVDHIDHNPLNNRRSNLRITTNAQNKQNLLRSPRGSKTGVLGVSWVKDSRKWRARIKINQKHINLGCFEDIEDAIRAVREARAKYMPFSQEALQLKNG